MMWVHVLGLMAVFGFLCACGGGGSDDSARAVDGGGTGGGGAGAVDEKVGGLWVGTTTNDQLAGNQQLLGISTDDGRFRFLSLDSAGQFIGSIQVNGTAFTGAGTGYAPAGATWIDGSLATSLTVEGTVEERDSLSGEWAADTGESGTFTLSYDSLYERGASLPMLAAVWSSVDQFGNPVSSFTIDDAGRFDGQDIAGCLYTGQVSIVDPASNVYDLAVTVANCGVADGSYNGLGFLSDAFGSDDQFIYSIDRGSFAFIGVLLR